MARAHERLESSRSSFVLASCGVNSSSFWEKCNSLMVSYKVARKKLSFWEYTLPKTNIDYQNDEPWKMPGTGYKYRVILGIHLKFHSKLHPLHGALIVVSPSKNLKSNQLWDFFGGKFLPRYLPEANSKCT